MGSFVTGALAKNLKNQANKLSGKTPKLGIPCLAKNWQAPCKHCDLSREYYKQENESEGQRLWAKKFICYLGIVLTPKFEEFFKKISIIRVPIRVNDKIISRILSEDALGWGNITHPKSGSLIYLSKKVGDDKIPVYDCDKGKPYPLKTWEKIRPKLINVLDTSLLATTLMNGKMRIFTYKDDMTNGDVASLRLLPNPLALDVAFFGMVWMHYNCVANQADNVWKESGYNPEVAYEKLGTDSEEAKESAPLEDNLEDDLPPEYTDASF